MKLPDFDFQKLAGYELIGIDYTLSRLIVAEFLGPAIDELGVERQDALTQLYLYFVSGRMSEADFSSQPLTSPSFPPFERADGRINASEASRKKTVHFVFKPGYLRIDYNNLFFTEEQIPMSHR